MGDNETTGNIEENTKDVNAMENETQPIPQPMQPEPQPQPQQYQAPQPQPQYQAPQPQPQYQAPQPQPQYQVSQPQQPQYYGQPQQPPKPKQEKAKIGAGKVVALVAACAVAAGAATWGVNTFMPSGTSTVATTSSTVDATKYANQDGDTNLANAVAATGTKSVVSIYTYVNQSYSSYGSIYDYIFGGSSYGSNGSSNSNTQSGTSTLSGLGSGVIIRSDGYILTNYHVIEDADSLKVEIDGTEYDGTVVGGDATSDIAVVKVDKTGLSAIEVADSSDIQVGDWVMAIGSPRGYEETVTTGIVSALGRSTALQSTSGTSIYANLIQTDASINSGNSGGALLDENAKLIGINTLISSESGDSSGLGFAIPSNYAMNIANQIIENGKVQHAKLGVTLTSSTDPMGATIKDISVDSSADKAGLKSGDIITKFGDDKITTADELVYAVYGHLVNDEVEVTYVRDGKEATCKITLGANETDASVSKQSSTSSSYSRS